MIAESTHTGLFKIFPRNLRIYFRCDANKAYLSAKELLQEHEKALFPKRLSVTDVSFTAFPGIEGRKEGEGTGL